MLKQWTLSVAIAVALSACGGQTNNANTPSSGSNAATNNGSTTLLNVSYDVTRDFYKEYNPLFVKHYQTQQPQAKIDIQQSHGGSSKQAMSVANGLAADVVTMNQTSDIELLQKKQLVANDWQQAFPNQAMPFSSVTVLIVKKGNPKNIRDWSDLAKDGVQIVVANPKTSGNGRYGFLAAYGDALKQNNGNHEAAKTFIKKMLANVAVLDAGGRGATTTFTQRGIGDVLINPENEAHTILKQFGSDQFEIVYPKYTITTEAPVAVVNSVTDKKGSTPIAREYLNYLWSNEVQQLVADFYFRPSKDDIRAKYADRFPAVTTFRANDVFGSWDDIMKTYFADGGVFDQLNQR